MSTTAESTEKLLADLRVVVRDAEEVLRATAGDLSEKAKETRSRLSASLETAKANCERLQDQVMDQAISGAHAADDVIRDHPYQTLGVAFGVGVLLGVLVGRK